MLEELEKTDFTIDGIGHRIVQGGWYFDDSAVVDDEVMAKILEVAPLAPLHNYGEAAAIEYCREKYPELPNVAVFDTSFHMTMPEVAYTYALPKDVCDKYHVRKYGAHGTSHRYEWMMAKEILVRAATVCFRATWATAPRSPLLRTACAAIPRWASRRSTA